LLIALGTREYAKGRPSADYTKRYTSADIFVSTSPLPDRVYRTEAISPKHRRKRLAGRGGLHTAEGLLNAAAFSYNALTTSPKD
jgi:hypothetical protein